MSQTEKNIEFKVGLLVLIALGLLATFIIVLGRMSSSAGSPVYLDMNSSSALKTGAPVKIAGVEAGKVMEIKYHGGEHDNTLGRPVYVRARLTIRDDMLPSLTDHARFAITTEGILGEKYVEIDPVVKGGTPLKAGAIVQAAPPAELDAVMASANEVLTEIASALRRNEDAIDTILKEGAETISTLNQSATRIDAILEKAKPQVDEVITKAIAIEDQVGQALDGINVAIGDGSTLKGIVDDTAGLMRDARQQIRPISADLRQALQKATEVGERAESLLAEVQTEIAPATAKVQNILADIETLTGQLRDGQGTVGALLSDRDMYDDIRELMRDLKRHPWKFIWKE